MLGDNIKRLMKENGYTQKELAIRSGCTESAISRYANDKRAPTAAVLKALAIALGVTVDELMACKECGRCIHYPVCEAFVSPRESFPEVEGGCGCFKDKDDYEPSGTAIDRNAPTADVEPREESGNIIADFLRMWNMCFLSDRMYRMDVYIISRRDFHTIISELKKKYLPGGDGDGR